MKLIVYFNSGEYYPVKDAFKKIFNTTLKWVGNENGWIGKDESIIATKPMETGAAITFLVDFKDDEMFVELKEFLINHLIIFDDEVKSFDGIKVIKNEEIKSDLHYIVDRCQSFKFYATGKFSDSFVEKWGKLLLESDQKINEVQT